MSDADQPPSPDTLTDHLRNGEHDAALACLDQLTEADAETRRRTLRAAEAVADDRPDAFDGLAAQVGTFLTDDDRAVRLTTAKLLVTLAESLPGTVLPVVDSLAARLADEAEFYFVRARCAEALGYVALDHPGEVIDPSMLADLRVGLSFDRPAVKEKLAKALASVALGDPGRLRHQVGSLAEHLSDDSELVRYHLCTALVVVGCERPAALADATDALSDRLADESPYVRGRAAEALGLIAGADDQIDVSPLSEAVPDDEDAPAFLTDRVRFARQALADDGPTDPSPELGTVQSVREGTDDVVAAITAPDEDAACPHCGLEVPDGGPPVCPGCGLPQH